MNWLTDATWNRLKEMLAWYERQRPRLNAGGFVGKRERGGGGGEDTCGEGEQYEVKQRLTANTCGFDFVMSHP